MEEATGAPEEQTTHTALKEPNGERGKPPTETRKSHGKRETCTFRGNTQTERAKEKSDKPRKKRNRYDRVYLETKTGRPNTAHMPANKNAPKAATSLKQEKKKPQPPATRKERRPNLLKQKREDSRT